MLQTAKAMMPDKLISVITPTYNRANYLLKSIDSVLNQSPQIIEHLVVDDGSTDDTSSLAKTIADPRFRYIRKPHSGAPATRNAGIEAAHGRYILWLDSDDELKPGILEHYIHEITQFAEVDIFYGDLEMVDETGKKSVLAFQNYYQKTDLLSHLIRGTIIPNPGTLVRKSLYSKHGLYDLRFRRAHDFEFWSRALADASIKHCGVNCCRYRWHRENMSSGNTDLSFEAGVVKLLCSRHPPQRLFPELDWDDSVAEVKAWEKVAGLLESCHDFDNALVALDYANRYIPQTLSSLVCNSIKRRLREGSSRINQKAAANKLESELSITLIPATTDYAATG
ncbi:MAG: glycosyltransferase [Granulosicoccus sp.]|nr:glycosyltransferase [Granulosicoccus sp.]